MLSMALAIPMRHGIVSTCMIGSSAAWRQRRGSGSPWQIGCWEDSWFGSRECNKKNKKNIKHKQKQKTKIEKRKYEIFETDLKRRSKDW